MSVDRWHDSHQVACPGHPIGAGRVQIAPDAVLREPVEVLALEPSTQTGSTSSACGGKSPDDPSTLWGWSYSRPKSVRTQTAGASKDIYEFAALYREIINLSGATSGGPRERTRKEFPSRQRNSGMQASTLGTRSPRNEEENREARGPWGRMVSSWQG